MIHSINISFHGVHPSERHKEGCEHMQPSLAASPQVATLAMCFSSAITAPPDVHLSVVSSTSVNLASAEAFSKSALLTRFRASCASSPFNLCQTNQHQQSEISMASGVYLHCCFLCWYGPCLSAAPLCPPPFAPSASSRGLPCARLSPSPFSTLVSMERFSVGPRGLDLFRPEPIFFLLCATSYDAFLWCFSRFLLAHPFFLAAQSQFLGPCRQAPNLDAFSPSLYHSWL